MTNVVVFKPECYLGSTNIDDFILKYKEFNKEKLGIFYLLYIGKYDGFHNFKLGQSDDFETRILKHMTTYKHRHTGKPPIVHYLLKSPYFGAIENCFKLFIKTLNLLTNMYFEDGNKVELFKITINFGMKQILTLIDDITRLMISNPTGYKHKSPNTPYILKVDTDAQNNDPAINNNSKIQHSYVCQFCDDKFVSSASLSNHRKTCKDFDEMTKKIKHLENQNEELKKQISDDKNKRIELEHKFRDSENKLLVHQLHISENKRIELEHQLGNSKNNNDNLENKLNNSKNNMVEFGNIKKDDNSLKELLFQQNEEHSIRIEELENQLRIKTIVLERTKKTNLEQLKKISEQSKTNSEQSKKISEQSILIDKMTYINDTLENNVNKIQNRYESSKILLLQFKQENELLVSRLKEGGLLSKNNESDKSSFMTKLSNLNNKVTDDLKQVNKSQSSSSSN